MDKQDIIFEEQCRCAYEAAELVMAACGGDDTKAYEILNEHMAKADTDLENFYENAIDGISAIKERSK